MVKILLFILVFITYSFCDNISWNASYSKALKIAHEKNKNLMILITSSKEKKSNMILKEYFMNQDYIKYINENFVSLLVNI